MGWTDAPHAWTRASPTLRVCGFIAVIAVVSLVVVERLNIFVPSTLLRLAHFFMIELTARLCLGTHTWFWFLIVLAIARLVPAEAAFNGRVLWWSLATVGSVLHQARFAYYYFAPWLLWRYVEVFKGRDTIFEPLLHLFDRCVPTLTGTTCNMVDDVVTQFTKLNIWMTDCAGLYILFALFVWAEVTRRHVPGPVESLQLLPLDLVYRAARALVGFPAAPNHSVGKLVSDALLFMPLNYTTTAWVWLSLVAGIDVAFNMFILQLYLRERDSRALDPDAPLWSEESEALTSRDVHALPAAARTANRRAALLPYMSSVYIAIAAVCIAIWMPSFAEWGLSHGTVAGQTELGKATKLGARVVIAVEYSFAAVLMYMIPDVRASHWVQEWCETKGRLGVALLSVIDVLLMILAQSGVLMHVAVGFAAFLYVREFATGRSMLHLQSAALHGGEEEVVTWVRNLQRESDDREHPPPAPRRTPEAASGIETTSVQQEAVTHAQPTRTPPVAHTAAGEAADAAHASDVDDATQPTTRARARGGLRRASQTDEQPASGDHPTRTRATTSKGSRTSSRTRTTAASRSRASRAASRAQETAAASQAESHAETLGGSRESPPRSGTSSMSAEPVPTTMHAAGAAPRRFSVADIVQQATSAHRMSQREPALSDVEEEDEPLQGEPALASPQPQAPRAGRPRDGKSLFGIARRLVFKHRAHATTPRVSRQLLYRQVLNEARQAAVQQTTAALAAHDSRRSWAENSLAVLSVAALNFVLFFLQVHLAGFVDSDVFGPGMLLGLMIITTATLAVALRELGAAVRVPVSPAGDPGLSGGDASGADTRVRWLLRVLGRGFQVQALLVCFVMWVGMKHVFIGLTVAGGCFSRFALITHRDGRSVRARHRLDVVRHAVWACQHPILTATAAVISHMWLTIGLSQAALLPAPALAACAHDPVYRAATVLFALLLISRRIGLGFTSEEQRRSDVLCEASVHGLLAQARPAQGVQQGDTASTNASTGAPEPLSRWLSVAARNPQQGADCSGAEDSTSLGMSSTHASQDGPTPLTPFRRAGRASWDEDVDSRGLRAAAAAASTPSGARSALLEWVGALVVATVIFGTLQYMFSSGSAVVAPCTARLGEEALPWNASSPLDGIDSRFATLLRREAVTQSYAGAATARRLQHAKQHGCVRGEFVVSEAVSRHLRHGIFAEGARYKAWLRFSTDGFQVKDDIEPAVRGLALKLVGVPGPKVLASDPQEERLTQDLLFVTSPIFFMDDVESYPAGLAALFQGPAALARWLLGGNVFRRFGFFLNVHRMQSDGGAVSNLLHAPYFSATAYRMGPEPDAQHLRLTNGRAVKYVLRPCPGTVSDADIAADESGRQAGAHFLRAAMKRVLDQRDACFELFVQEQKDPCAESIEDVTREWNRPEVHIATLTIPRQAFLARDQMQFCENLAFTPWHSLPEHRPLGRINRARLAAYEAGATTRRALNNAAAREPTGAETFGPDPMGDAEFLGRPHSNLLNVVNFQYRRYDAAPRLPKYIDRYSLLDPEVINANKFLRFTTRALTLFGTKLSRQLLGSSFSFDQVRHPDDYAKLLPNTTAQSFPMRIVRQLTQASLGFEVPDIARTWREDSEFARQWVSGINPREIRRLGETNPLPQHLSITNEVISRIDNEVLARRNWTYDILLETRNLYFADYPLLHELPLRDDRHLYAPTVLFFVEHCTPESPGTNKAHGRRLMPLLIQLTRLPSGNRVFLPTPDDEDQDSNEYWVWQFAKMHVQSADGHMHELVSHLGYTHLVMEPVVIAFHRQLPSTHPVFRLMQPHFYQTLAINEFGRGTLLKPEGSFDRAMSLGIEGSLELMQRAHAVWTLETNNIPLDMQRRGVDDDHLPGYYYKEDSLAIWRALEEYVHDVVNLLYPDDHTLKADQSLQALHRELVSPDFAELPSIPPFTSRSSLVSTLTTLIYTATAQHAAVNFGQYYHYAFLPARPLMLNRAMPDDLTRVDVQFVLRALPGEEILWTVLSIGYALSTPTAHQLALMGHSSPLTYSFSDLSNNSHLPSTRHNNNTRSHYPEQFDKLWTQFGQISRHITNRNLHTGIHYPWLDPFEIPSSIAI